MRWKTEPTQLPKHAIDYLVEVRSGNEVLAERQVSHQQKAYQNCVFTQGDFGDLDEDSRFEAQVVIRALAGEEKDREHGRFQATSEEFVLCFGDRPSVTKNSVGRIYPSLALAVADIAPTADAFDEIARRTSDGQIFSRDRNGFISCRYEGKTGRVFCPDLLLKLAHSWVEQGGAPGWWRQRIRADGSPAAAPEFIPVTTEGDQVGARFVQASKAVATWLGKSSLGPLAVLYTDQRLVEYVNAAIAWWEAAGPDSTLIHTLEVVGLAGQQHGLIVLPTHPLRVAWQQGFDHLVRWHCFEDGSSGATRVKRLLGSLAGAHYPAILPGFNNGKPFVFADALGFHAVAMTPLDDAEPKATVALLSRLLAGANSDVEESVAPSIGRSAADLLAGEVATYLRLHPAYRHLRIHALRPGDAKPAARALGKALRQVEAMDQTVDQIDGGAEQYAKYAFELDLYPAEAAKNLCGHFLSTTAERRRSGAGHVPEDDRWILESVRRPGGRTLPRLHWSRRSQSIPETPAHLALAFDLLSTRIELRKIDGISKGNLEVHGLSLVPERTFCASPVPHWLAAIPTAPEGEKHPAGRSLSERLVKAHAVLLQQVCRQLGGTSAEWPVLVTAVTPDQQDLLDGLHRLCDWVVSVDRHAGVEYFDSPIDLPRSYEAYLIDCVPERDDLGFLQLITSTSSLDEIRALLESALAEMGLSPSPANCRLLLNALKSLSGRLAMRLSNAGATVPELVALALFQSQCGRATDTDTAWLPLTEGFFVPLDDVPELLQAPGENAARPEARADLLYVTAGRRGGLRFAFVEVKFRRYLKTARSADVVTAIEHQLVTSEARWEKLYGTQTSGLEKTIMRSRLARILRFYLKKARRHYLTPGAYERLSFELDRLARESVRYELPTLSELDRSLVGFVLCPECAAVSPIAIQHSGRSEIWLFGPGPLGPAPSVPVEAEDEGDSKGANAVPEPNEASTAPKGAETAAAVDQPSATPTLVTLGHEEFSGRPVEWRVGIRSNPHLLIVGLPGMGKTSTLIQICRQLTAAGITPIIFSYHQDIDEKLGSASLALQSIRSVTYAGLGFNPMQVIGNSPLSYVDNVAMLRDIFAAIFPDLGDVQLGSIREALKQSYVDRGWSASSSGAIPAFQDFFNLLKNDSKTDRKVLLRLGELDDYGFFASTSGGASLLESPVPTIVQIHVTQNELLQRAFASFVLQNIYQSMFRRGTQQRITHAIIFDEAHRAAKLKLIPTMAKECRKYGLAMIVASQEVKDFDDSMFTAIASYLALRVNESDARKLAKIFAPSDKLAYYTDRLKQTEKYKGWFSTEGLRAPVPLALLS